jgi:plastocyanin
MGRLLALGILGTLASASIAGAPTYAAEGRYGGQAGGTVTGTITTAAKGVAPIRVTIDQKVCGNELPDEAIVVDAQGRLANAVVILTGVKRPAPADVVVSNEKCRFTPRVQIVAPKTTVKTTSKDAVLHTTNAQLESGRTLFNVALPIPGITVTKPLAGTGNVRLSCNTHPWMRGWMVVTDEAAAVTGADGRFTIDNVPPGTYELRVWHETLKGAPQKVTVSSGKASDVAMALK